MSGFNEQGAFGDGGQTQTQPQGSGFGANSSGGGGFGDSGQQAQSHASGSDQQPQTAATPMEVHPSKFSGIGSVPPVGFKKRDSSEFVKWTELREKFVMVKVNALNVVQTYPGDPNKGEAARIQKTGAAADVIVLNGPGNYQLFDRQHITANGLLAQIHNVYDPAEGGSLSNSPIVAKIVEGKNRSNIFADVADEPESVRNAVGQAAQEAANQFGW